MDKAQKSEDRRQSSEDRGQRVCFLFSVLCFLFSVLCPLVFSEEPSAYAQAVASYRDRHLKEAFRYAKEAVRKNPQNVEAYFLLGELYYLRQELEKARESWERALELAPSRQDIRQRLEKLEAESKLEKDLARSDTHPFVVRFAEGETPLGLGGLRELLRETYRKVGQDFQYFPDHPITVILYPEKDFERARGSGHRVGGLYDGKIRLPLVSGTGLPAGPLAGTVPDTGFAFQELKRTLWHEYTHALVHDLAKGRCPTWLNEGIAGREEGRIQRPDLSAVQAALKESKLLLWAQLWDQPYDPAALDLLYGQSYLVVRYLVDRWGFSRLVSLLKRLGEGTPIADALRAEYRKDPLALEKEWLSWLNRYW